VRNYSSREKETKKRIIGVSMKDASSKLYEDEEIREIWQGETDEVSVVPVGSLALISKSENGIPDLLSRLEEGVAKPFIDNIPENFLDNILKKVKETRKKNKVLTGE
ncbi:MAG: hypothetical protein ACP5RE_03980, partial [Candidatus Acidifodinimicrobium sp.]